MDTLLERLKSPTGATAAHCERQVARAERLNGPDLLYGAAICHAANRPEEGNFLLVAGQVRASADMSETVPARKVDYNAQSTLYSILYLHMGGPGKEGVYRDPASRGRFFRLFDSWRPGYGPDYEPGWKVRARADPDAYRAAIAEIKAGRRKQIVDVARLYSDSTYFPLHRRFLELQARNPDGFVEGTADAALAEDLQRRMDERSAALGLGPPPADEGGDPGAEPFPPAAPAPAEAVVAGSADPVVQRCAGLAESYAVAGDLTVARVLITSSAEWGIIWRADLAGAGRPLERFTCTDRTSAYRPLDMGDESIPPLPERAAP